MAGTRQQEERRWGAMAEDLAGVGYWWMDARTETIHWSPNMFKIFGFETGVAPPLEEAMARLHPEDRATADAALARNLAGEATKSEAPLRVVWPDGEVRYIEGRNACQRGPDGEVAAVYGTLIDQTEHILLEAELAAARDAAQAATAVKAEFLANMSHELRTPLTSVLGFSALLASRDGLDETARDYVDHIAGASAALMATVNDILDFSKLEAGQVEIKPQPADPVDIAREALGMFTVQAEAKGITLDFAPTPRVPGRALFDPDRLRQILLNLIGNAVKFTDQGAVGVAVDYDDGAGALRVTVRDSGPGLTREQQARLFQRFSQVDAGSTRQHGGTGLGLAICKGLAEAMGGGVGVRSRPGVGSAFTFHIQAPAVEDDVQAAVVPVAAAGPPPGARLLVVDDNRGNRDLVRAILSPCGLEIAEAADGAAAVAAAEAGAFDLILMDVRMPGMDGPTAAAHIRAGDGPCRAAPILAFSADADPDCLAALLERGFDGVLSKPVVVADLIAAVVRWTQPAQAGAKRARA